MHFYSDRFGSRAYQKLCNLVFVFFLFALTACGGGATSGAGGNGGGGAVTLTSITVSPANQTLEVGTNLQLAATGNYSDGSARDLSGSANWTSSATQVATVSPSGLVNAVASGATTITATSGGISGNTTVNAKITQATVSYIHVFAIDPADGAQPNGPLFQANDGNFYGTTRAGGVNQCSVFKSLPCGVIFKLTPGGTETTLYSFGASATDGYSPQGPLVQGADGALYGTTSTGGDFGGGTVFRVTLGGVYSILYSFGASSIDGRVPTGGLIVGSDGNFYGTTSSGGANTCSQIPQAGTNCGTVFKLTPAGVETVLHSFGSLSADGITPTGSLLQASDGNFYGTTQSGGTNTCSNSGVANSCGTVFKLTPAGVETVLHSFGASQSDGIAPQGTLIQGTDGALYGTTASGGRGSCGNFFGCGTVFRVALTGQLGIIYEFARSSLTDGYGPSPYLIQATDGNFYGTTGSGGSFGGGLDGTIFRLSPSGVKTTLYSFGPDNQNPSHPETGVVQASDGAFYGVTFYNGQLGAVGARSGFGAVFKLATQ